MDISIGFVGFKNNFVYKKLNYNEYKYKIKYN